MIKFLKHAFNLIYSTDINNLLKIKIEKEKNRHKIEIDQLHKNPV